MRFAVSFTTTILPDIPLQELRAKFPKPYHISYPPAAEQLTISRAFELEDAYGGIKEVLERFANTLRVPAKIEAIAEIPLYAPPNRERREPGRFSLGIYRHDDSTALVLDLYQGEAIDDGVKQMTNVLAIFIASQYIIERAQSGQSLCCGPLHAQRRRFQTICSTAQWLQSHIIDKCN